MTYYGGMSGKNEPSISDKLSELHTKESNRGMIAIIIIVVVLLIAAVSSGVYFYIQYQNAKTTTSSSTKSASEVADLIKKVGDLMVLPTGENPTVATVSDVSKLKGQTFFAQAHNGDKVLIYQKARKAILYSPTLNKIVEYGPINVDNTAQSSSASPSASIAPTPKIIKVTLRNGTKTVGLAATIEKDLTAKTPNILVVSKDNAAKQDYTKTLVIDLSGTLKDQAKSLAGLLGGEVGSLPTGEVKPTNADILVILGKP